MMCQSWCAFVAGSSDHHFDSDNYPQQSYRAADLHRWDAVRTVKCYGLRKNICVHSFRSLALLQFNLVLCGWSGCSSKPAVFTGPPDWVFCLFVVVNWRSLLSSHLDLLRNSTLLRSDIISVSHDNPPSVMNTDPQESILTSLSVHDRWRTLYPLSPFRSTSQFSPSPSLCFCCWAL